MIATGAMIGIEAASGLAGEVRVGRHGLKRFVIVSSVAAVVLLVGVSTAALMAVPVENGHTAAQLHVRAGADAGHGVGARPGMAEGRHALRDRARLARRPCWWR